jgi:hypothetical protein
MTSNCPQHGDETAVYHVVTGAVLFIERLLPKLVK